MSADSSTESGKATWAIVNQAKTENNQGSDAKLAFDKLESKYQGKTAPTFIELEKKFANMKLNRMKMIQIHSLLTLKLFA